MQIHPSGLAILPQLLSISNISHKVFLRKLPIILFSIPGLSRTFNILAVTLTVCLLIAFFKAVQVILSTMPSALRLFLL
jgi:hypothetical protein